MTRTRGTVRAVASAVSRQGVMDEERAARPPRAVDAAYLPGADADRTLLLDAFVLEKALYELGYELDRLAVLLLAAGSLVAAPARGEIAVQMTDGVDHVAAGGMVTYQIAAS